MISCDPVVGVYFKGQQISSGFGKRYVNCSDWLGLCHCCCYSIAEAENSAADNALKSCKEKYYVVTMATLYACSHFDFTTRDEVSIT